MDLTDYPFKLVSISSLTHQCSTLNTLTFKFLGRALLSLTVWSWLMVLLFLNLGCVSCTTGALLWNMITHQICMLIWPGCLVLRFLWVQCECEFLTTSLVLSRLWHTSGLWTSLRIIKVGVDTSRCCSSWMDHVTQYNWVYVLNLCYFYLMYTGITRLASMPATMRLIWAISSTTTT